jgi:5-methylcytosine-specific restriction protein A
VASTPRLNTKSSFDGQRGPNGFRLCRQCGTECPNKLRRYCTSTCRDRWALANWPNVQRRAVAARDRGKCALCPAVVQVRAYPHQWEMDHTVPLCEGGSSSLDNLRTLCIPCHRRVTRELAGRLAQKRRATGGARG